MAARRPLVTAAVFALCLIPLALLVWRVVRGDYTDPVEAIQLETGIWALRFLAITLAITPLRRLTGWGWLVRWRRPLGLFAFFYTSLHLLNYVWLDNWFAVGFIVDDVIEHPWVLLGMLGFLLLVPLAITSTKGWIRRLGGRRWQRLHRLVYAAAIAGALHYLLAVKKDIREPLIYIGIFAVLLGARVAWRLAGARTASRASTTAEGAI